MTRKRLMSLNCLIRDLFICITTYLHYLQFGKHIAILDLTFLIVDILFHREIVIHYLSQLCLLQNPESTIGLHINNWKCFDSQFKATKNTKVGMWYLSNNCQIFATDNLICIFLFYSNQYHFLSFVFFWQIIWTKSFKESFCCVWDNLSYLPSQNGQKDLCPLKFLEIKEIMSTTTILCDVTFFTFTIFINALVFGMFTVHTI